MWVQASLFLKLSEGGAFVTICTMILRIYGAIGTKSPKGFRPVAFPGGTRQVGKTAVAKARAQYCLNWCEDMENA